jgi:hypothetical protein
MNTSQYNRLLTWITAIATVLWTLLMALGYGLVAYSDDVANWLNGLFGVSPEIMAWVSAAGAWLEQWGAWVLGAIWFIGLVGLLVLGWFANRFIRFFHGTRPAELT